MNLRLMHIVTLLGRYVDMKKAQGEMEKDVDELG